MTVNGFSLWPEFFDPDAQRELAETVGALALEAPFYRPVTPGGRPMSVLMTNFGALGWVSDHRGYRYQSTHPVTGLPWPPIPERLRRLWETLAGGVHEADACLVNLYRGAARMGAHQDRDEADFGFPVISVSLGDTAIFRIGGADRRSATATVRLASGDVCRLAGEARLAFHGVDRTLPGSSRIVEGGGRINLTLRRAAAGGRPG